MNSKHGTLVNDVKINEETVLVDNDHIDIGLTNLLFTLEDFDDRENALLHYKKVGERRRPTISTDTNGRQ